MAKQIDTVKLDAQLLGYMRDDLSHYRDCVHVKDHNTSQVVPLILNASQMIIRAVANKQMTETGRVNPGN